MLACRLVKTAVECLSAGNSSQIEGFQRNLCSLSLPVAEATDGGLKCFVGVNVKLSGLKGPAFWTPMTKKEASCHRVCCCCLLLASGIG